VILFEIEKRIYELMPFVKLQIVLNPRLKESVKTTVEKLKMTDRIEIIDNINMPIDKYEIVRVE